VTPSSKTPVINLPFDEPSRHFRFGDDGITNEIVESRCVSSYFVPIARPRSYKPSQMQLPETEWTASRVQENEFINCIRGRVAIWRRGGHVGITKTTARLLEYWRDPERERRLFFCQVEAVEKIPPALLSARHLARTLGARTATMGCMRRWLQRLWRDHPVLMILLAYVPAVVLAAVALLVAVFLGHALLQ